MSRRWKSLVEPAAIAVLIAGTAWLGNLAHHNYAQHGTPAASRSAPAAIPVVGDGAAAVPLAGRDRALLMLVMRVDCPFCEQNMPNWRDLVDRVGEDTDVLVLSTSESAETAEYLAGHGLDVPFRIISPAALQLLGLQGYPGTVGYQPGDTALATWVGVLQPSTLDAVHAWSTTASQGRLASVGN